MIDRSRLSKGINHVGWISILLVAFFLRLVAAYVWQAKADEEQTLFRFGDSHSYWVLANRISDGEPYQYGSDQSKIFRAPLYPLFLAPFTSVEDERWGVFLARIAGALCGTACIALIGMTATRMDGPEAGYAAAFLATLYPGAIGMSIFVLSEAIFCPLIVLSLLATSGFHRRDHFRTKIPEDAQSVETRWMDWLWGGVLTGLASLARPSWLLWPGVLLVLLVGQRIVEKVITKDRSAGGAFPFLAFLLGLILVMSPWWVRNFMITGKFVPTTLQVGASLYDGLHEGASGMSDEGMAFSEHFAIKQEKADEASRLAGKTLESTLEYRLDRAMFFASIDWAKENPSDVARLGLIKWLKTWSPWPTADVVGSDWIRYWEGGAYLVIVATGSIGCWHVRRQGWRALLFVAPCLYYGVLHTVFVGSVRYRQPPILILCILSGIGVAWLLRCGGILPKRS